MFQFSTATRREPYFEGQQRERPEGDQGLGSFSWRIFDVVSQFGKNDNAQRRKTVQGTVPSTNLLSSTPSMTRSTISKKSQSNV